MIALLPLDDRPCNTRFPAQIAAIGADVLTLPPLNSLGRFNVPGDFDALRCWLDELPEVEALIVSVDMLAYGGLVASRKTTTSLETALQRLEIVRAWRAKRPDVPVYAFNVLMRLAITMDSDAAVPHYYNVMKWARLCDEARRFPTPQNQAELDEVRALIPDAIIESYGRARNRNHEVNLTMIDWLAEGTFDHLLVTQEDCTEFGLHRREQDELVERARKHQVQNKFTLHPGADEAALTLLARGWNDAISFGIEWSSEVHKRDIAVFEDVPYEDALLSHIRATSAKVASNEEAPDVRLFVNAPVGGSQKNETPEARQTRRDQFNAHFLPQIVAALNQGERVALCDVAFPNGADEVLMNAIADFGGDIFARLIAFGGWNTAGNTTGTILAQCAALVRGQNAGQSEKTGQLNRDFLFERLLDDWFYQADLRARLEKEARDSGFSPLSMNGHTSQIEASARREIKEFARNLASKHFGTSVRELKVALPWGRTFEVAVGAKLC